LLYQVATKKAIFLGFRNLAFSCRHEKAIFFISEKSLNQFCMKMRYSGFSKNCFFRSPRKNDFFGLRKIGFQVATKKRFLFGLRKIAFSSSGEKAIFSGRHEKTIFSFSEKSLFQVFTKKRFFGIRKIAF
jgi:hypothetical protein